MPTADDFLAASAITVHDPLAALLGAPADGRLTYTFADAVKLAGHACPTVAGAWVALNAGLGALYGTATPVRGNLSVALPDPVDAGVTGVVASIATLLTGAAGAGGFKGLAGQHCRRDLLRFGVADVRGIRLCRLDTGAAVDCAIRLDALPPTPELGELMPIVVTGHASPEILARFQQCWQARVRHILLTPALVDIRPLRQTA